MGISEKVLLKSKDYINDKSYNFDLLDRNKINKKVETIVENKEYYNLYEKGDKVKLLDYDDYGIVYEEMDKYNNIKVLYKNDFIEVNIKRVNPYLKAKDLYPADYDLNSLFTSYKDRKLEKDIARGSKKALKKIQKEIKNNK